MMRIARAAALLTPFALCAAAQAQQYLMVVDWTDRVMLVSAQDGSIINADFIPDDPTGTQWNFQSPKAAVQVGNEIWVSDQISDAVYRFTASLTPTFFAAITGGMDNVRGLQYINGKVYVANSGGGNGAPGTALVVFNPDGTFDRNIPCGDPFDIAPVGDDLLVSNIDTDDLDRYTTDGVFVSAFHASDGINGMDFPQQITSLPGGGYMVAGFTSPSGIFVINPDGSEDLSRRVLILGGLRGVHPLANGNILYTRGSAVDGGLYVYSPTGGTHTQVHFEPNLQYITPLTLTAPPTCGTSDFNGDGDFGTDQDIEAFFACLAGTCCATCWQGGSDFNGDGDFGTDQDIEAFFRVLAGGNC
jgi:hypothetical protein